MDDATKHRDLRKALEREWGSAERQLRDSAYGLQVATKSTLAQLDAGRRLNTLGELQSITARFESAAGALAHLQAVLESIED